MDSKLDANITGITPAELILNGIVSISLPAISTPPCISIKLSLINT